MFFRRRTPAHATAIPDGRRVYAVGDVHGRLDLLTDLVDQIDRDDRNHEVARTTLIFLGDLIDRGPDSAGVVRYVRALTADDRFDVRLIMGNHEELLVLAASGDTQALRLLMREGGARTLASFGFSEQEINAGSYQDLARLMRERIPAEDLDFVGAGETMILIGNYAFVHAGVRPGVTLDAQSPADLRWIREDFLISTRNHGKIVVHGHTPTDMVVNRRNRIGIDTGAHTSGRLTAVGLEGDRRWFLSTTFDPTAMAAP